MQHHLHTGCHICYNKVKVLYQYYYLFKKSIFANLNLEIK